MRFKARFVFVHALYQPTTRSIGSVLRTRKTEGRISQGCAAVHSVVTIS